MKHEADVASRGILHVSRLHVSRPHPMSDNIRPGAGARVKSLRWMADPINDDRGTVERPAKRAASSRRRASAQPARADHDASDPGASRREGPINGPGIAGAKRVTARCGASLGGADGGG